MGSIFDTIEQLHHRIKTRKDAMTRVIIIYDKIHAFTEKMVLGKKVWDDFKLGRVGVYDKKVSYGELVEDIECVQNILNGRKTE